jgi:hypothetical protein
LKLFLLVTSFSGVKGFFGLDQKPTLPNAISMPRRLARQVILVGLGQRKRAKPSGRSLALFEFGRASLRGCQTRDRKLKLTAKRPPFNVKFDFSRVLGT